MTSRWLSVLLVFTWAAECAVTLQAQQAKQPPEQSSAGRAREPRLLLRTNAFKDAARLPLKYTCWADDHQKVSPPLQWSHTPKGTQSFTLMLTAPQNLHVSLRPDIIWVLWNIPASTTEIPEGLPQGAELPDGSRQVVTPLSSRSRDEGKSEEKIVGYNPPCAPAGAGELHYEFKLFALDAKLTLPSNVTGEDVLKAIDGHILGASVYYATMETMSGDPAPR
jgi:Raf kinase inhibitor-like YbhB/YbcL family protein